MVDLRCGCCGTYERVADTALEKIQGFLQQAGWHLLDNAWAVLCGACAAKKLS